MRNRHEYLVLELRRQGGGLPVKGHLGTEGDPMSKQINQLATKK